jgi:hypothetical protein
MSEKAIKAVEKGPLAKIPVMKLTNGLYPLGDSRMHFPQ